MYEQSKSKKIICAVAGHSGGHIIPCAIFINKNYPDHKVILFTTRNDLDLKVSNDFFKNSQIIFLKSDSISFRKWLMFPLFTFNFLASFFKSLKILYNNRPQEIISTGGIISIATCFAAKILSIPIRLIELNAEPGKAINFLAPIATTINTCFRLYPTYKNFKNEILINYPIRFCNQDLEDLINYSKHEKKDKKIIFILGGSQGSLFLNNVIKELFDQKMLDQSIEIIHQTSKKYIDDLIIFYKQRNILANVFYYDSDIKKHYFNANLIICRAGAGTLFEVLFFNKNAIIIPLQTENTSHQVLNAFAFEKKNSNKFAVVLQSSLNYKILAIKILHQLNQPIF